MGRAVKSTKKFKKSHLKRTIDERKASQQFKQKVQKRKTKSNSSKEIENSETSKIDELSVEDLFKGEEFQIPKHDKNVLKKNKKALESDNESSDEEEFDHKQDLAELAEKDPDFYKYLKNNDEGLLDFDTVDPLEAMDTDDDENEDENESEDEDDEDEDEESEKSKKSKSKKEKDSNSKGEVIEVTPLLVKEWETKIENEPSVKLLRNLTMAFKAAVNVGNDAEQYKYAVTDAEAFKKLMLLALSKFPKAIQKLVPFTETKKGSRTITGAKNLTNLGPIIKSHATSMLILLSDINNTDTAVLVLSSSHELLPYLISHRPLLKRLITTVVKLWGSTQDIETQIALFAFLNNASREYPKSLLELVLKSTYSTFIKRCRQTNPHTMPLLNFQKNSAAELFGINQNLSYQLGFDYIRQLAIHLRNSTIHKTAESHKTIYNWQYAHSLDFWSRVLSLHCNPTKEREVGAQSPLRSLIYPLVQVTLGATRLIPAAQFYPFRFYLTRSLIRLSQHTGVYIPLLSTITEILNSTAFTKRPKLDQLNAFDFDHNIKANSAYLGTKRYQEGISEQIIDLAGEIFVIHAKSVAFPELAIPAIIAFKRHTKLNKVNVKFNKQLQNLIQKLEQNSKFVTEKRSSVSFGPSNKKAVANFLSDLDWQKTPLGGYVVVQREVAEEKARILRESLAAEEEERKAQKEQELIDEEAVEGLASSDSEQEDEE